MSRDKEKVDELKIPGQIGLFEFLADTGSVIPKTKVKIEGVINTQLYPMSDFVVQSTYTDIFYIINMCDDYVRILTQPDKERNLQTDYMIRQFDRISRELSEQICLDKEKMYKKCRKRQERREDIGEDAMILASRRRN
jgi:hypothetical protein